MPDFRPYFAIEGPLPWVWKELVGGRYQSRIYPDGLVARITPWEDQYPQEIGKISQKRAENRRKNYLVPEELQRVKAKILSKGEASIRFGNTKTGHGYHGERGDFCLVGGAIKGAHFSAFYRSLELIGGLAYDLCLIDHLATNLLGKPWKSVTIYAARANVFALKGNSNERLFPKLRDLLRPR